MRTQSPPLSHVLMTVAFALICVLLLLGAWFAVGGSGPLRAQGYRISIPFAEAPNIVTGSDVRVTGVKIGRVASVRRDRGRARVEGEIDPEHAPLRAGTRAALRTKTLLGEGFVELAPGPSDAPMLAENSALPVRDAREAVQLDELLSTFTPRARRDLRGMFAGLADAVGEQPADLAAATDEASRALPAMREVLDALDGQRPQLQDLMSGAADVLGAVGRREAGVRTSLEAGNRFLKATGERAHELERTVAALPPFLRQLRVTSGTLSAASGDLTRATRSLRPVAPGVAPALRAVRESAPDLERLFAQLGPTARAGERGLPALTRIARSAPQALREVYPAARDLAPITALLAADRRDMIGIMANIGSVMNGVAIGPTGKPLAYGTGFLTVWNEVIGGYAKKLPTNRPNPYPKPGALDLFAEERMLRSFQCRHTGNPLIVPPTGTGVPPCVEQGPWELLGKRQYYPRLSAAPEADMSRDR